MRPRSPAPLAGALPRPRTHRRMLRVLAMVLLVLTSAAVVGGVVLAALGMRCFTVETPSMGSAAPVGTLVVSSPASITAVHVGDIIVFRPPTEPQHVYTHRVAAITPDGIRTRGDINGAADGWRVTQHDLVGRAVALMPGVGFLVRAIPMLVAGNAIVWLLTTMSRVPAQRAALRNIGFHLVAALPSFVLHPFVQILVLQTRAAGGEIAAAVVSTGLLPVRVSASTGQHLDLRDGQVGTLTLPTTPGGYHLTATLDPSPAQLLALIAICVVPLAWTLIVGLPDGPAAGSAEQQAHPRPVQDGPVVAVVSGSR